jgi:hypothetical protein
VPRRRLSLCRLTLRELVADGAHDRGIAYGTIVERHPVNHGHRVEQAARFNLGDDLLVLGANAGLVDVVIDDAGVIAKPAAQLGGDDGRDLLRRPRRSSTTGKAIRGAGNIEDLDNDWLGHRSVLST